METFLRVSACIALAMPSTVVAPSTAPLMPEATRMAARDRTCGDALCGPRCVQFILQQFGHRSELLTLLQELPLSEVSRGASLQSLQELLERRGVYCEALAVSPQGVLRWGHPVLVHLEDKNDPQSGHYVVWLPTSSGEYCDIWDGAHGSYSCSERRFASSRSGAMLLTSPTKIEDSRRAVTLGPAVALTLLWGSAISLGVTCVYLMLRWQRASVSRCPVIPRKGASHD
jgi:ABC-type bacteriocin/lantibiotic exporter with double-glycine peptidase domain